MDISLITDYLLVGTPPQDVDAALLEALDVGLVISMIGETRPGAQWAQPPFELLWLRTYDTIFTPIPVATLMTGAAAALPVIERGGRVLTFCRRGVHRSVAMACAILIARGHSAGEAIKLVRARRAAADPRIWYVRRQIMAFERAWRAAPPAASET